MSEMAVKYLEQAEKYMVKAKGVNAGNEDLARECMEDELKEVFVKSEDKIGVAIHRLTREIENLKTKEMMSL